LFLLARNFQSNVYFVRGTKLATFFELLKLFIQEQWFSAILQ